MLPELVSRIVTDCTPETVLADFKTALVRCATADKTDIVIVTQSIALYTGVLEMEAEKLRRSRSAAVVQMSIVNVAVNVVVDDGSSTLSEEGITKSTST